MSYREDERKKIIDKREDIFKDPGNGLFFGKERDFVLKDPAINLWEGIREDAKEYFKKYSIPWWKGTKEDPTGHLLSSQIACLNHLYYIRQREDIATVILQSTDSTIQKAVKVDEGFVEFEFIGEKQYLSEKGWMRGANCTSIDAVMIGERKDKTRVYFLIEWKYTESYTPENKYIEARAKVYDDLIKSDNSPFKSIDVEALYYEPFYQMMRQTLLGEAFIKNKDHGCSDYYHLHVIPEENKELMNKVTSPKLDGNNISEAWKSILKNPDSYKTITPEMLLQPVKSCIDTKSILNYLQLRYWC